MKSSLSCILVSSWLIVHAVGCSSQDMGNANADQSSSGSGQMQGPALPTKVCRAHAAIVEHGCGLHGWSALNNPYSPPASMPDDAYLPTRGLGAAPVLPLGHIVYRLENFQLQTELPDEEGRAFYVVPDNTAPTDDAPRVWTLFAGVQQEGRFDAPVQVRVWDKNNNELAPMYPAVPLTSDEGEPCAGVFSHEVSFMLARSNDVAPYRVQISAKIASTDASATAHILFDPAFQLGLDSPTQCETQGERKAKGSQWPSACIDEAHSSFEECERACETEIPKESCQARCDVTLRDVVWNECLAVQPSGSTGPR
jgi:hypothetical protein